MIAKQAATLDVLSGGRFELGLGAGAQWGPIEAMGGPRRSPAEAVDALEDAIRIIRLFWSGEESIELEGRYYSVDGVQPGPPPAHPIGIWVGAYKPRMLEAPDRVGGEIIGPVVMDRAIVCTMDSFRRCGPSPAAYAAGRVSTPGYAAWFDSPRAFRDGADADDFVGDHVDDVLGLGEPAQGWLARICR